MLHSLLNFLVSISRKSRTDGLAIKPSWCARSQHLPYAAYTSHSPKLGSVFVSYGTFSFAPAVATDLIDSWVAGLTRFDWLVVDRLANSHLLGSGHLLRRRCLQTRPKLLHFAGRDASEIMLARQRLNLIQMGVGEFLLAP